MSETQQYQSPDGLLRLFVDREDDDTMVGFEGFQWHTHADLLTPAYGPTEDEAVANFVRDILGDRIVIVVARIACEVKEISVTDEPANEWKYVPDGQIIELRYWHGTTWSAA